MNTFLQLSFAGLALGCVYALIALGFVIVFKGSGTFNFAHGEFVMVGAFVVVAVAAWAPYGVAVLAAVGVLVALTLVVERTMLRPLVGQPVFTVAMTTLGLAIMLRAVVAMIWGYQEKGYADPIGLGVVRIGDVSLTLVGIWTVGVTICLLMALWVFFRYSRIGLAMRAAAEDQEAALAQGIDVRRTVAWSWAISGGLAVAAAIFLGAFPRQVGLEMGFVALAALPAVIIGGFDSLAGAVIGGGVVGLVQIYSADYLADVAGGNVQTVAPYIVMMAVLAIRPTGLFGSPDVDRV